MLVMQYQFVVTLPDFLPFLSPHCHAPIATCCHCQHAIVYIFMLMLCLPTGGIDTIPANNSFVSLVGITSFSSLTIAVVGIFVV